MENFVFSTSGQIFGVGWNGNSVDLSAVWFECISDLEVSVPNFESSVPTDWGEVGLESDFGVGLEVGGVSHLADPVLMVVGLTGVLAVGQSVPKLDFVVGSWRDNLSVVGGEGHGENFLLVSDKLTDCLSGSQVPESEGLVPWGGDTEESVVGEGNIGNEVVVSCERFVGNSVNAVLAFLV